jgi:hypothetical protein
VRWARALFNLSSALDAFVCVPLCRASAEAYSKALQAGSKVNDEVKATLVVPGLRELLGEQYREQAGPLLAQLPADIQSTIAQVIHV